MVYAMVFWHNFIIPEDYISTTLGLGTIVMGQTYNYKTLCKDGSKYSKYAQTYKKTTNTMRERTISVICLQPTGNTQGLFYYYSL